MEHNELLRFANPLYDAVFRYMMEDNKVAKLFLSAVIGEKIIELSFNPTEYTGKAGADNSITLTRMDFNARIEQADGTEKLVIIEIQKAKFYYQIMRFRKYLGKQYQNPQNKDKNENPLPIYPIYILGQAFTEEVIPVIRVQRGYIDAATDNSIPVKHPFIEALTHDATVIQVKHLKQSRRTILEQFLSIFDQSNQQDNKGHILAINESDYPKRFHPVIRRLIKALQSPQIEDDMDMEDEVIHEFNKQSEIIEAIKQKLETEKQKTKAEKQKAKAEKQKAKAEKQKAETEKQARYQLIKNLANTGMSIEQIATIAEISQAEIQDILES